MSALRALLFGFFGLLFVAGAAGCEVLHELKPHRLHRWNRGPGMESGYEAYYSVPDPIPTTGNESAEPGEPPLDKDSSRAARRKGASRASRCDGEVVTFMR